MIDFFYNIIIFPIIQIIEITFSVVYRIFSNRGLAIIGVSAAVTFCTMPLYFMAEKLQDKERDLQKKFKPKIDKIKAVFRGDERHMILSTYYRQNHYHPIYAMRNSLGILVQIPFFIAAYSYLSHLEFIKGSSFLFIDNLGAPDGLLSFGKYPVNVLPVLMTLINCASGAIYTKGRSIQEKLQIYITAFVFLFLLYASPSGLVLYWTMNNIFSLLKNILSKTKYAPKIIYAALCLCILWIDIRFAVRGFSPKRLFVAGLCSTVFFLPLFLKLFRFFQKKVSIPTRFEQSSLSARSAFIFSALILCVLSGFVIPGSLIASSVQEFSYLDSYTTPLPFVFIALIQSVGICLFWPLSVYFLFSEKVKRVLTFILSMLSVIAIINTYIFPGDYGFLTTSFKFSNPDTFESNYHIIVINGIATLGILGVFVFLLLSGKKIILYSLQLIILIALTSFGFLNTYRIQRDFSLYRNLLAESGTETVENAELEPVYRLSKNGKNVIVFMLDAAVSAYLPYIFSERPELFDDFSGFTYYPNCASFGTNTRIGAPNVFGGYEYQPSLIQKNRSYAMSKHNESLLMMPRIFQKNGYEVTVTDPAFANYSLIPDLSIFAPYPEISAQNIQGKYTGHWLRSHPELKILSISGLLKDLLIRFSLFRMAPPAFRVFVYDKSNWLKAGGDLSNNQLSLNVLDCYTSLDYFPKITEISSDEVNTYTAIVNELPHDSSVLQYPDYTPSMDITNFGDGPFSRDEVYHVNIAGFILTGKWLQFLRQEGVYDNTRIIVVSDHGHRMGSDYHDDLRLPGDNYLSSYNPVLLVKDFNSSGTLTTDNTFMTNADVPLIATEGLIENPVNPFSGVPLKADKDNGILITTATALQFTVADDQWLRVHDNVFTLSNWEKAEK